MMGRARGRKRECGPSRATGSRPTVRIVRGIWQVKSAISCSGQIATSGELESEGGRQPVACRQLDSICFLLALPVLSRPPTGGRAGKQLFALPFTQRNAPASERGTPPTTCCPFPTTTLMSMEFVEHDAHAPLIRLDGTQDWLSSCWERPAREGNPRERRAGSPPPSLRGCWHWKPQ